MQIVMIAKRLGSGLAALTLAGMLAACGQNAAPVQEGGTGLRTETVSRGQIARIINSSGKVKPEITVNVGSEVSGKIIQLSADYNSTVKTGDILAIIDPTNFENRVAQARAALEDARAQIRIREASIQRSQITLDQSRAELNRMRALYEQDATSQTRLETAEEAVGVAEADLALAKAQLDAARSALKQDEASLKTALVDLDRTTIRSPIDGVVIERKVDAGQTVAASFSAPELFVIAKDLSTVQVEAAIVESDVRGLGEGDPVTFTVDAYPAQPFRGLVDQLRLNAVEQSNIVTYTAVVTAQNPEGLLMPGMTANLQIITDMRQDVLRVPAAAERFRPTPDILAQYQEESADTPIDEWVAIRSQVTARLATVGVSPGRIEAIGEALDDATISQRDILADPTQSFRRTPALSQMQERISNVLQNELSPSEMQGYNQLIQQANTVREAEVWVQLPNGKIAARKVGLGLSDGAFVEVVSGLEEGDQVVTGISAGRGGGGPPGGGMRRPGAR